MTRTLTTLYVLSHRYREKLFTVLIASIIFVGFAYVFLLQKAIINVVDRQKLSQQITKLSVQSGDLEAKYFSMQKAITVDLAHTKGFKSAEVTAYISKKSETAAVAFNHEL